MSWLFSIPLRTVNNTKTQEKVSVCTGPKHQTTGDYHHWNTSPCLQFLGYWGKTEKCLTLSWSVLKRSDRQSSIGPITTRWVNATAKMKVDLFLKIFTYKLMKWIFSFTQILYLVLNFIWYYLHWNWLFVFNLSVVHVQHYACYRMSLLH